MRYSAVRKHCMLIQCFQYLECNVLTPYTVRISGAEEMPARERIAVELRFIDALQCAVGGPDAVVRAWREDRTAFEKARAAATVAAWGDAPPAAGATFEIHARQVIDL